MKPLAILLLGAWLCLPSTARAQNAGGADNLLLTVATTTTHAPGSKWVYITWLSSNPQLLSQHSFAVYRKDGAADAAAPYQRVAIVAPQTDGRAIRALLQRAAAMGRDVAEVERTVNDSFDTILPGNSNLRLEEKLAALIRGARDSSEVYENLTLLAQRHPTINLCRGHAYAARVPAGLTTFEIRQLEVGGDAEAGVVGRVTVDGSAAPLVLPAPGAPLEVLLDRPDRNDQLDGLRDQLAQREINLSARLRWPEPPELLRMSALQAGYNLFRVERMFAESKGWGENQPSPSAAALRGLIGNGSVARVNNLPIFVDANPADAADAFFTDDNDAPLGGQAFQNGDQFYYFVAARDLLGRDGQVSPATLVTILDRSGPLPPSRPRVENTYDFTNVQTPRQQLKISWDAPKQIIPKAVVRYHVYRWRNVDEIHAHPEDPAHGRVGTDLADRMFVDQGVGPADVNKNWFYTVRAEYVTATHDGAHAVLTGHSAPWFGVLRDREAPAPPVDTVLTVRCAEPSATYKNAAELNDGTGAKETQDVRLVCNDTSGGQLRYAEFFSAGQSLGRAAFNGGQASLLVAIPIGEFNALKGGTDEVGCRVAAHGILSATASRSWSVVLAGLGGGTSGNTVEVRFDGDVDFVDCTPGGNGEPPPGLVPAENAERTLRFTTTAGTREWKLYRRIDDGPLTFIARGETGQDTPLAAAFNDVGTVSGFICYFLQFFDRHGNAGPLREVACIDYPSATIPRPELSPLAAVGSETNRTLAVTWFCPPYGVDHFELLIARKGEGRPLADFGTELSENLVADGIAVDGVDGERWGVYRTGRVRGRLAGNQAEPPSVFTLNLPVAEGTYLVAVRAVSGRSGNALRSVISNIEELGWAPLPKEVGPQVPWPARPLPPVRAAASFNLLCVAGQIADNYPGNVVRIGELSVGTLQPLQGKSFGSFFSQTINPNSGLFRLDGDQDGVTPFPCVLYRYRVTDEALADASLEARADIVQVSPLIQGIAHRFSDNPIGTEVPDPYIILQTKPETSHHTDTDILLVDRHPVIRGARYRYLLTRFDPRTREIDAVYYTNVTDPIP